MERQLLKSERVGNPTCGACGFNMKLKRTFVRMPSGKVTWMEEVRVFCCPKCESAGLVLDENTGGEFDRIN